MEKKTIKEKIKFDFSWTYGVEIEQLKKDLDELEKLGATEIEIEAEESYGCASITIEAFKFRLETDDELEIRLNKTNEFNERQKQIKLAQFEKLKSELGL